MTNSEAHATEDFMRSERAFKARMALPRAERLRLYAAHKAGDWSAVMEIMGEDVGRN